MCVYWLLLSHFLNHRLLLNPCSVRRHKKHAFPLGAGHILPPAVRLRRPTPQSPPPLSPPLPHPTPLFLLLPSLVLPVSPSFPRPETEIVWWQRCRRRSRWSSPTIVPTGLGVDTFLPVLGLHQSALCALRSHIPPHQELLLSSHTGVWLHWTIVGEWSVWMFLCLLSRPGFSLPLPVCASLFHSCPSSQSPELAGQPQSSSYLLNRSCVVIIGSRVTPTGGQLSVIFENKIIKVFQQSSILMLLKRHCSLSFKHRTAGFLIKFLFLFSTQGFKFMQKVMYVFSKSLAEHYFCNITGKSIDIWKLYKVVEQKAFISHPSIYDHTRILFRVTAAHWAYPSMHWRRQYELPGSHRAQT